MVMVIKMKTKIINEIKKGKYYYYELENTIFYVEGGGQLKDEGTINGIEVLSCFEDDGHIYHQTAKPIKNHEVELVIDEHHRYISRQGHTAQHLLSAAFYDLYQLKTISHHYNLEGSYIDLQTQDVSEEMLVTAENYVNSKIREHREVRILYPTKEEFEAMPIHHTLKVDHDIRIVHIEGVEYNPCKGMHVSNTSEVQMVVVLGKESVKGVMRIHYMFGEVARNHFHMYQKDLKNICVELSKPMNQGYDGFMKFKQSKEDVQRELNDLQNEYIQLYLNEFKGKNRVVKKCHLQPELLNKLCLELSNFEDLECYLFTDKQIIIITGNKNERNAKVILDELKQSFEIRGGGNPKICKGASPFLEEIEESLKNN